MSATAGCGAGPTITYPTMPALVAVVMSQILSQIGAQIVALIAVRS